MNKAEFIAEVRKRMALRQITAPEMADIAHMNVKTWYRNMKDPGMFRWEEIERMCKYIGLKISID